MFVVYLWTRQRWSWDLVHPSALNFKLRDAWDTQNIPPEFQNTGHLKSKINTGLAGTYIKE